MNNDMKCPFCQQELERVLQLAGAGGLIEEAYLLCSKCNIRGERKLWQALTDSMKEYDLCHDALVERTKELDRTRKALDVAIDALKMIGSGDIIEHSVVGHEDDNKIFIANKALEQITALEQKEHFADVSKKMADRMIGCTTLDIPESYKTDQLTLATLDYSKKLEKENSDLKDELERTRKENEDKQAVLNCVVDMLKTLNQKYTLIMGKNVIKETVRLLEQKEEK